MQESYDVWITRKKAGVTTLQVGKYKVDVHQSKIGFHAVLKVTDNYVQKIVQMHQSLDGIRNMTIEELPYSVKDSRAYPGIGYTGLSNAALIEEVFEKTIAFYNPQAPRKINITDIPPIDPEDMYYLFDTDRAKLSLAGSLASLDSVSSDDSFG